MKYFKRKEEKKMPNFGKRLFAVLNYPRTLPVYLCALCSKQRKLIEMDIARWNSINRIEFNMFESINWYMTYQKEFRNLIQHRLKNPSRTCVAMIHFAIARMLWKPLESLYIYTEDIGGGLYIQHGFATIITAKKIGENCRIYQQVTIGYKNGECPPVLEDNVSVTCGAKVLGDITMHTGSLAAAGSVVVKDVPENAIVAGVPARIIAYKDETNLDFQG